MTEIKWPKGRIIFLISILVVYIILAVLFRTVLHSDSIKFYNFDSFIYKPNPLISKTQTSLYSAEYFFDRNLLRKNGHINLYLSQNLNNSVNDNETNSEAISYYLLWSAETQNKQAFDSELNYIEKYMIHPRGKYLMWRLESDDKVITDGENMASDADLRTIKALFIAEDQWGDKRYTDLISQFAYALEKIAVTRDNYLAPYGGIKPDGAVWTADEVWLSYSDFQVFEKLASRRGDPWISLNNNMKSAVLKSQNPSGLYNYTLKVNSNNGDDGENYSINSLWIMVRSAESNDPELQDSAAKSLKFYKEQFERNSKIYASYNSQGFKTVNYDAPWVYALVGRAALVLGDENFTDEMIRKITEGQDLNHNSIFYGSFPEGIDNSQRAGQFTTQESIITMEEYLQHKNI